MHMHICVCIYVHAYLYVDVYIYAYMHALTNVGVVLHCIALHWKLLFVLHGMVL